MDISPQPPLSRRDRRKHETIADIKAAAVRQLADGGPAGISMRAIARELDVAASAVHYYFPSRQALVEELTADGFAALAAVLRSAHEQAGGLPPVERWLAVTRAHRTWALRHSSEYLLIYGHTGCAALQMKHSAAQALQDVVSVLFACMRDCVSGGDVDVPYLEPAIPPGLREQFSAWRAADALVGLPDAALAACMYCYSRLHGAIALELAGHLPLQLTDHDALFELEMRHTVEVLHRPVA